MAPSRLAVRSWAASPRGVQGHRALAHRVAASQCLAERLVGRLLLLQHRDRVGCGPSRPRAQGLAQHIAARRAARRAAAAGLISLRRLLHEQAAQRSLVCRATVGAAEGQCLGRDTSHQHDGGTIRLLTAEAPPLLHRRHRRRLVDHARSAAKPPVDERGERVELAGLHGEAQQVGEQEVARLVSQHLLAPHRRLHQAREHGEHRALQQQLVHHSGQEHAATG
eukprot:scaffold20169_cov69-Phaeocystis_antarctica.AAC.2